MEAHQQRLQTPLRSFNSLVIGSSVLIHLFPTLRSLGPWFQSPSNRVKCSDDINSDTVSLEQKMFQSPSNRVKCSDTSRQEIENENLSSVSIP